MTIPELIIEYLSSHRGWQIKGSLEEYCKQRTGSYVETLGRTCRKMSETGRIESTIIKGLVYYKLKEERKLEEIYQPKVAEAMRQREYERVNGLNL